MATYQGRFKFLAKPASEWGSVDPVLLLGEFGVADPGASAPTFKCGDGVRPWSALPSLNAPVDTANDYVAGVTTTLPPGSPATVVIDNAADPPTISFGIPAGDAGAEGPAGPANSLAIGAVTTGAPGSIAAASITGAPPAQVLNLTIPTGATGAQGVPGAQGIQGIQGPPGVANLANPSALIGLAAINGVSVNAMRADGAPALSQAIVPTWTGPHTFSGNGGLDAIVVSGADPVIRFADTNEAADHKGWRILANGGQFRIGKVNDAVSVTNIGFQMDCVGNSVSALVFGSAATNPTYTFLGTGVVTAGGVLRGPDGSASAPTYSMTTTPGTGMYGASDNTLRFSTNSAITMYLDSPNDRVLCYYQLELNQNGTAARPSFSWVSHTNSGMYKDTSGFIYFSVVGTQQFRIHNTGVEAAAFTSTSSRAIKRETGAPTRAGRLLARLRPILYRLLAEDSREQLGLIAEEVQAVCPQLSDGNAVAYDRLALLLLADWQESRGISSTPKG